MKKSRLIRIIAFAAALMLCALCMSGCSKYSSSYRAVGFVHSNVGSSAFMNFYTFEGRMAFTLRQQANSSGMLKVNARLEDGSATVYYDDGEKRELFSIGAGEALDTTYGPFDSSTVYILVETTQSCQNGEFSFEIE